MAPQRQKRCPPELNEDVIAEILLRLPPDEPKHLIRASVVSKLWHRVVTNADLFHRCYRAFHHGSPPLLGFFFYDLGSRPGPFTGFVPTTTAASSRLKPKLGYRSRVRWVSDCRHGCALLGEFGSRNFVVWDPFSGHREELVEAPQSMSLYANHSNAVVLGAVPFCDHGSCRRGPFRVVCVGIDDDSDHTMVHAHVYSSESRSWCTTASAQLDFGVRCFDMKRAAVIGDGVYCTIDNGARLLKYDLVEHRLSFIALPYLSGHGRVLMQNEDGSLGIAEVLGSRLYLRSRMVNAEGVAGWVQRRVIELQKILDVDMTYVQPKVIGFAEGVEVFFISTYAGAFTFELKSGRLRWVGRPMGYHCVAPFISFFTPGHGCSKWTKSSLSLAQI